MNQEISQVPVKALAVVVAVVVVALAYMTVQYVKVQDSIADLTYKYRVLATTDIASIPPSDFELLLSTPPELIPEVMTKISVVRGEVAELSEDTIVLNAKVIDVEKVKDVLTGKEVFDLAKKPRPETLKKVSIGLTLQTQYLINDTPVRVGDLVTVVTFEPVLFSETLTAQYVFPVIPGLTN